MRNMSLSPVLEYDHPQGPTLRQITSALGAREDALDREAAKPDLMLDGLKQSVLDVADQVLAGLGLESAKERVAEIGAHSVDAVVAGMAGQYQFVDGGNQGFWSDAGAAERAATGRGLADFETWRRQVRRAKRNAVSADYPSEGVVLWDARHEESLVRLTAADLSMSVEQMEEAVGEGQLTPDRGAVLQLADHITRCGMIAKEVAKTGVYYRVQSRAEREIRQAQVAAEMVANGWMPEDALGDVAMMLQKAEMRMGRKRLVFALVGLAVVSWACSAGIVTPAPTGIPTERPTATPTHPAIVATETPHMLDGNATATAVIATPTGGAPISASEWRAPTALEVENDFDAVRIDSVTALGTYLKGLGWDQAAIDEWSGYYNKLHGEPLVRVIEFDCDQDALACLFVGKDTDGNFLMPQGGDLVAEYPYYYDPAVAELFGELAPVPDSKDARMVIVEGKPVLVKGSGVNGNGDETYGQYWDPFFPGWKQNSEVQIAAITATPAAEVLAPIDVTKVPAEVIAGMNSVTLKDDDAMRWTYSQEYGMYGKMNEKGELQYLVYPMHFSVDGKESVVYMPMYVSCTEGAGAMCVLSGMEKSVAQHGVIKVNGTDTQARAFFDFVANHPEYQDQNPSLLGWLRDAAEGRLEVVEVIADISQTKDDNRRVEGQPQSRGIDDKKRVVNIAITPFVRDGKLYLIRFSNAEFLLAPEDELKHISGEAQVIDVIQLGLAFGQTGRQGSTSFHEMEAFLFENGPEVDLGMIN